MSFQLSPGTIVEERYEILSLIGQGGSGAVYKAQQIEFQREIAMKFLLSSSSDNETFERFRREGVALSELSHKSIPTFFHFGIWNEQIPYIAMELLEGKTLRSELIQLEKLSTSRALNLAIQVCECMAFAHNNKIIHRDLKPENIFLIQEGETESVKICDFGLAKFVNEGKIPSKQTLTKTGLLLGTVNYMSPEQCQGQKADLRSDIYSLACIIFEMLKGEPPFTADNPIGVIHKHNNEAPPLAVITDSPSGLRNVLSKALQKNPLKRYQSMLEFKADLKLLQEDKQVNVEEAVSSTEQSRKRSWIQILTTLSIVVATAFLAIKYFEPKKTLLPEEIERDNTSKLIPADPARPMSQADADIVLKRAKKLLKQKKYQESSNLYSRLVEHNPRNPDLDMLLGLAESRYAQKQFKPAADAFERALKLPSLTANKMKNSETMVRLADTYLCMNSNIERSEQLAKESLSMREQLLGKDNSGLLPCLRILSKIYKSKGNTKELEPIAKRWLQAAEDVSNYTDKVMVLQILISAEESLGNTKQEEEYLKELISFHEGLNSYLFRDDGPYYLDLARLYNKTQRWKESLAAFRKGIKLQGENSNTDQAVLTGLYHEVGEAARNNRDHAVAEFYLSKALVLSLKRSHGEETSESAEIRFHLGVTYQQNNDDKRALPLIRESLEYYDKKPDSVPPEQILGPLAHLSGQAGDTGIYYSKRVVEIVDKKKELLDNPLLLSYYRDCLSNLSRSYVKQGKSKESAEYSSKARTLSEPNLVGPSAPN